MNQQGDRLQEFIDELEEELEFSHIQDVKDETVKRYLLRFAEIIKSRYYDL